MTEEETRFELRQIQKAIEREERIEALKAKHEIVGTREEQKELVIEKKEAVEEIIRQKENER